RTRCAALHLRLRGLCCRSVDDSSASNSAATIAAHEVCSLRARGGTELSLRKGVSMHPEFKAYVEAVCSEPAVQVYPGRVISYSGRGVPTKSKNLFTFIADFLAEFPPYYCELKMVPGVKPIPGRRSSHRDAIGYHGLV